MKHFDFVEIGTAYFGTLIECAGPETVGISVEPVRAYLDLLPNKPQVTKVHAAITDVKTAETIEIYYVPAETITRHGLGDWLAGCNSVNKPHDFHLAYTDDPGYWLSTPDKPIVGRNLVAEGLVKCERVPILTFPELGRRYDIGQIDKLQIDTEGHDPNILFSVLEYYAAIGYQYLPRYIQFEHSRHSDRGQMKLAVSKLLGAGYDITFTHNDGHARLPE